MDRRTFVRAALVAGGTAALGGSLWRDAASAATALPGPGPYGPLLLADRNDLQLPLGFRSRVVAWSGFVVPDTSYTWHSAPDGGACLPDADGWIYVSNSEVRSGGGVGAIRFDSRGRIRDAYSILTGSANNCSGGATPWGTWLSCEEVSRGYVWETFPQGGTPPARRPAMGRFKHEAAAVDPVRQCVYLTEDEKDGCFYRFVPTVWPRLSRGRLDVMLRGPSGRVGWAEVPDPDGSPVATRYQVDGVKRFAGGEGCVYADDRAFFTTKGDNRVWRFNPVTDRIALTYDDSLVSGAPPLLGVDAITRALGGDLFVAEDGGDMEICMITPGGVVAEFCRVLGHDDSEITGTAFSPDGSRLYFSSQRGPAGSGVTYEIRGPFRR